MPVEGKSHLIRSEVKFGVNVKRGFVCEKCNRGNILER